VRLPGTVALAEITCQVRSAKLLRTMSHDRRAPCGAMVELTQRQLTELARAMGRNWSATVPLRLSLAELGELEATADRGLSRAFLTAMKVWAVLPANGDWISLADLTRASGMISSSAHRYVSTLRVVGIAEQDEETRLYRAAPWATPPEHDNLRSSPSVCRP